MQVLLKSLRWTGIAALAGGIALAVSSCTPNIEGEEGNLRLTFDEGALLAASGSEPLAVESRLDFSAEMADEETSVKIVSASSDDDQVILVEQDEGQHMTLSGRAEGEVLVDVEAEDPDGQTITDTFELAAAEVDGLEFEHICNDGEEAYYLVDHDIGLRYKMQSDGDLVVGHGHYPVEFEPAEGAALGETDRAGYLPLQTASEPGEVTVASSIDDGDIELTLVEEADIVDIELTDNGLELPVAGEEPRQFYAFPLVEDDGESVRICQSDLKVEIDNRTDDICEVRYTEADNDQMPGKLFETNAVEVEGLQQGECEFGLSLVGGNGGEGFEREFTIDIDTD